VLARTLEDIREGMSEREVAAMLSINALRAGAQGVAFSPLAQVGKMAAYPHGGAGDARIKKGDCLLIDFGYTMDDYPSDLTRTVFVGEPSAAMRNIYEVVRAANAAGVAACKPGVTCEHIDRVTRKVIESAGYGKYFTHRTGHGLGLEGHEAPYIVEGDTTVLEEGMLFTVEPGIYVEGVGGVRIEDNVIITKTGAESLTTFPRELSVIG
jgi:Xaa-Pro dipeptidase